MSARTVACRLRSATVVTSTRVLAARVRHSIGGPRGGCAHSLRSRPQCSPFVRAYVCIATRTRARRRCTHEVVDKRSEANAVRPCRRGQSRSAGLTSIEFAASAPAPRFFTLSGHRLCRAHALCYTARTYFFSVLKEQQCTPNYSEPSPKPDTRISSLHDAAEVNHVSITMRNHRGSPVHDSAWDRCSFGQVRG